MLLKEYDILIKIFRLQENERKIKKYFKIFLILTFRGPDNASDW